MTDLERDLLQLGSGLEYPPTPDLARGVGTRLERSPHRRRAAVRRTRRPVLRVAAISLGLLLLTAGTVLAASPAARDAVLEFLGLRGATVERAPERPRARLGLAPGELGERASLEVASRRVGFPVLVPSALGRPEAVFLSRSAGDGEITLLYGPRRGLPRLAETGVGLLVSEFRGDLGPPALRKVAGPGTRVERVTVDGRRGIWLEGASHVVIYESSEGDIRSDEPRLAGNTLLLERGRLLIRIEVRIPKRRAIAIARGLG